MKKISPVDASNYFRGLLLLIRKDRKVTETEIALMKRIGKSLGFEPEFCDHAIRGILENEHIREQVPKFSTKELAVRFVQDGLTLAYADNEIHPEEEQWLRLVAELNEIDLQWFFHERDNAARGKRPHDHLEVEDLSIEESMK